MRASSRMSSEYGQPASRIASRTRARNTCGRKRRRSRLTRMINQPWAAKSASRSMSRACCSGSSQCCGPSYSTPTFHSSHPISMRPTKEPYSSTTTIWVRGLGKPAAMSSSRVRVSCGDSAPPSISSTTRRNCTFPRAPRRSAARRSISSDLRPVAFASASTRMIAVSRRARRPISKAVRAGVVAGTLPTTHISSCRSFIRWITTPSTSQVS